MLLALVIPPAAHLIWLGPELPWVTALAAASAAARGGFETVIVHHADALERSRAFADLLRVPGVEPRRFDPLAWVEQAGGPALVDCYRDLVEPAARANVLRLALLRERGGVYLDADTVTVRSLDAERRAGGFFCGEERLAFPESSLPFWVTRIDPRALTRTLVRDLCRRLPSGYRYFRRIEGLYPRAANNAVLGSEAGHPFAKELIGRMCALSPASRRVRYALGTHLLQAAVGDWDGGGLSVLPPETFFPLGPEISEHWFRPTQSAELDQVLSPKTLVVHWYASVRVRAHTDRIDAAWVRAHARTELFSALALPIVDELGW